jgi:excisionase family DNA binding protein
MTAGVSLEDLLITSRAAGLLGVSVSTFTRYVHNGWIAATIRVGRSNLYRREDVEALYRKLHPHEGDCDRAL